MHLNDCRLWCWLRDRLPASRLFNLAWLLIFLGVATSLGAQEETASEDEVNPLTKFVGMERFDVEDELGEAQSAMHRDGVTVLTFPGGERLQLQEGVVIGVFDRRNNVVVAGDGTQYLAGEDGRLRMPDMPRVTSRSPGAAGVDGEEPGSPDGDLIGALGNPEDLTNMAAMEKYIEDGGIKMPEPEPPPPFAVVIGSAFVMVLRFSFAAFILVVAMRFKNLPFFMSDLFKVAALYVAVREGVHHLGDLGGSWKFITLFRVDDVAGLFAMILGLQAFNVVRGGLLVFKVAIAAKAATYAFMVVTGFVLTMILTQLT